MRWSRAFHRDQESGRSFCHNMMDGRKERGASFVQCAASGSQRLRRFAERADRNEPDTGIRQSFVFPTHEPAPIYDMAAIICACVVLRAL
jgi:hypothetical protein